MREIIRPVDVKPDVAGGIHKPFPAVLGLEVGCLEKFRGVHLAPSLFLSSRISFLQSFRLQHHVAPDVGHIWITTPFLPGTVSAMVHFGVLPYRAFISRVLLPERSRILAVGIQRASLF